MLREKTVLPILMVIVSAKIILNICVESSNAVRAYLQQKIDAPIVTHSLLGIKQARHSSFASLPLSAIIKY